MTSQLEPMGSAKRGEGQAMADVSFRDPVDVERRAATLQLDIARTLVRAPALPVALPAFDLTLLGVECGSGSIDLVIGKTEAIAKLKITRLKGSKDDSNSLGESSSEHAVDVTVVEIASDAARFSTQLNRMADRLRPAITLEKWRRTNRTAKELAELPANVPLAFYRQLVPGVDGQALVRVGFRCNQKCGICWQDRQWGTFDATQIRTWIEDLGNAGARSLIISGGEPTLDPDLETYITHAREIGFHTITLETNAILFANGKLAPRLRDAGLSDCFVSLHSGDSETSDFITRAPGTFARTVTGIKALLAANVPVRLNCVLTGEGIDHLDTVPDLIHREFGADPNLRGLMLSQPSDPFDPTLTPSIVPEPQKLRDTLYRVIDRAFDLEIEISGLDGPCGPPLCAFGADPRITDLAPIGEALSGRTYLPLCDGCAVRHACFGPRLADVELYGEACVAPISKRPKTQRSQLPTNPTVDARSSERGDAMG